MAPDAQNDRLYSFRSSCERCRWHKLKCIVPDDSQPRTCERCTRANVSCVFGRRRRANTSKSKDSARYERESSDPIAIGVGGARLPTPPSTITPVASLFMSPGLDAHSVGLADAMSLAGSEPPPMADAAMASWQSFKLDDYASIFHTQNADTDHWGWLQCDSVMTEPPYKQDLGDAAVSPPLPHAETGQRLISLVGDMQQHIEVLEQGPWQHGINQNLDQYPIGTVLQLFQQFSTIAVPVLVMATESQMKTVPHPAVDAGLSLPEEKPCAGKAAALLEAVQPHTAPDTSTTLLILGGYLCLVRIYTTVLGHFQTYLSRMPGVGQTSSDLNGTVAIVSANPGLQLGELPYASAAPNLARVHTALSMLLTAQRDIEEQLGRGGAVARNLVIDLLTKDVMAGSGGFDKGDGLLDSITLSVKELLREKMGL